MWQNRVTKKCPDEVCKSGRILANFCYFSAVTKLELFTILQFCIKIVTLLCQHRKMLQTSFIYYTFQRFHRHLLQSNRFLVQKW